MVTLRIRQAVGLVAAIVVVLLIAASPSRAQQNFDSRLREGLSIDPALFRQFFATLQSGRSIRLKLDA